MTAGHARLLWVGMVAVFLSGCATMFTGTEDPITFESTPAGATVLIDGKEVGKTPTTVRVKRKTFGDTDVTLRMRGYEDRTFELDKKFNMMTLANLGWLLGGPLVIGLPIGTGVDAFTGAVYKYEKDKYTFDLERRTSMARELGVDQVVLSTELEQNATGALVIGSNIKGKTLAVIDPEMQQVMILK